MLFFLTILDGSHLQINLRFETVLVKTVVSKEAIQSKVNNDCLVFFAEDEDAVRWSMQAMTGQNLFKKNLSLINFHLFLYHGM
jgi:hypothetical protein